MSEGPPVLSSREEPLESAADAARRAEKRAEAEVAAAEAAKGVVEESGVGQKAAQPETGPREEPVAVQLPGKPEAVAGGEGAKESLWERAKNGTWERAKAFLSAKGGKEFAKVALRKTFKVLRWVGGTGVGVGASWVGVKSPFDAFRWAHQRFAVRGFRGKGGLDQSIEELLAASRESEQEFKEKITLKDAKPETREKGSWAGSGARKKLESVAGRRNVQDAITDFNKRLKKTREGVQRGSEQRKKLAELLKASRRTEKETREVRQTKIKEILDEYTTTKVTGMQVARESLNTAIVATGFWGLRPVLYGLADAAERYLNVAKEARKRGEKRAFLGKENIKETIIGGIVKTYNEAFFRGEAKTLKQKAQRGLSAARALGNIARYAGMGAMIEWNPGNAKEMVDRALDGLSGIKAADVPQNFVANVERYARFARPWGDLSEAPTGRSGSAYGYGEAAGEPAGAVPERLPGVEEGYGRGVAPQPVPESPPGTWGAKPGPEFSPGWNPTAEATEGAAIEAVPSVPPEAGARFEKHADYQGGNSVWNEGERQLNARFGEKFKELGEGDLYKAEALKTYNIDRIKDTIVANPEKYGFSGKDINVVTREDLGKIKWDRAFEDTFAKRGLTAELSSEQIDGILKSNAAMKAALAEKPVVMERTGPLAQYPGGSAPVRGPGSEFRVGQPVVEEAPPAGPLAGEHVRGPARGPGSGLRVEHLVQYPGGGPAAEGPDVRQPAEAEGESRFRERVSPVNPSGGPSMRDASESFRPPTAEGAPPAGPLWATFKEGQPEAVAHPLEWPSAAQERQDLLSVIVENQQELRNTFNIDVADPESVRRFLEMRAGAIVQISAELHNKGWDNDVAYENAKVLAQEVERIFRVGQLGYLQAGAYFRDMDVAVERGEVVPLPAAGEAAENVARQAIDAGIENNRGLVSDKTITPQAKVGALDQQTEAVQRNWMMFDLAQQVRTPEAAPSAFYGFVDRNAPLVHEDWQQTFELVAENNGDLQEQNPALKAAADVYNEAVKQLENDRREVFMHSGYQNQPSSISEADRALLEGRWGDVDQAVKIYGEEYVRTLHPENVDAETGKIGLPETVAVRIRETETPVIIHDITSQIYGQGPEKNELNIFADISRERFVPPQGRGQSGQLLPIEQTDTGKKLFDAFQSLPKPQRDGFLDTLRGHLKNFESSRGFFSRLFSRYDDTLRTAIVTLEKPSK